MYQKKTVLVWAGMLLLWSLAAAAPKWAHQNDVTPHTEGFEVTGVDPFLVSAPFEPAGSAERNYLRLAYKASRPTNFGVYWMKRSQPLSIFRYNSFPAPQSDTVSEIYVDFNKYGCTGSAGIGQSAFPFMLLFLPSAIGFFRHKGL